MKNLEVNQVSKALCLDVRGRERVASRVMAMFLPWMTGWMEVPFTETKKIRGGPELLPRGSFQNLRCLRCPWDTHWMQQSILVLQSVLGYIYMEYHGELWVEGLDIISILVIAKITWVDNVSQEDHAE